MPRSSPGGITHEVLALAHECIQHSAIAGRVGLSHATVNCIPQGYAATRTLVPGKCMVASRKTTPREDHALLRTVQQNCFISSRAFMAWLRNLYAMQAGKKTHQQPALVPWLPLCLEWAQRWQNPTMAHWQHIIFGDNLDSNFTWCMAGLGYVI